MFYFLLIVALVGIIAGILIAQRNQDEADSVVSYVEKFSDMVKDAYARFKKKP